MKKYTPPVARKINYEYDVQIVAASPGADDLDLTVDGFDINVCTFDWPACQWTYRSSDCEVIPPTPPT